MMLLLETGSVPLLLNTKLLAHIGLAGRGISERVWQMANIPGKKCIQSGHISLADSEISLGQNQDRTRA